MNEIYDKLTKQLRYELVITDDGCWLFTGGTKNYFHGTLWYEDESWQAHRLAYVLIKGPIPKGLNVLHSCDVGRCINPDHLFLGTQQDNIQDMIDKGRSNYPQKGGKNGRALVDDEDVLFIRYVYGMGVKRRQIANEFDLSFGQVSKIVHHEAWRHL